MVMSIAFPLLSALLALAVAQPPPGGPGQPQGQPGASSGQEGRDPNAPRPIAGADELLGRMREEGSWSIVLMDTPGKKITFEFGPVGQRVVELKWARERGASIGEVGRRLDELYEEEGGGGPGSVSGKGFGGARSAQAYEELQRTVRALNRGRFASANSHLTLLESAARGLQAPERDDYAAAAGTLRRAHAILAGDEALKRLVLAAPRRDFREREKLKAEIRAYAKDMGIDPAPFLEAASRVWDAYAETETLPDEPAGDLAAALRELDAAEKMVQGPFKRSAYAAAFERMRRFARGLKPTERKILAERLRRHAAMWSRASADTLAFALLSSLSSDPAARARRDQLLDQAYWKGTQGAYARNLERALLST